jgi:hypothetical protein
MTTSEIATVLAWHDALSAADLDTLVALSSDDIEIGDPHGAAQGHAALRTWAASQHATSELGRMYVHDGIVVVEWGGAGLAFRIVRDHVTSVFRHDDLSSALDATELGEADLVN